MIKSSNPNKQITSPDKLQEDTINDTINFVEDSFSETISDIFQVFPSDSSFIISFQE